MNAVFLMDPLEGVIFEKDTTLALMIGAHARGYTTFFLPEGGITLDGEAVRMHVEEVDAHTVLAEEDRLRGGLVGADAVGAALVGDLQEARDIAAATGDVADLEGDLLALGVLGEIDEGETTSGEEFDHTVGTDVFACFELDHDQSAGGAWGWDN